MDFSKLTPTAPKATRRISSAPPNGQATKTASAAPIETLYIHPNVKIVSFTAPAASPSPSMDVARLESGTLPSSSRMERTIAVGSLRIYRAPGSVAFLSCSSALQPILPKSQCWCVDEDSARFVLQIRRPNFWRIELPTSTKEYRTQAVTLREVFDMVLQFEKTLCPFQRTFTVELPYEALVPVKKKPWTPKHPPNIRDSPDNRSSRNCESLVATTRPHDGASDFTDLAISSPPANTTTVCGAKFDSRRPHFPSHKLDMPRGDYFHTAKEIEPIPSGSRRDSSEYSQVPDKVVSSSSATSDAVASVVRRINSRLSRHVASAARELATPSVSYAGDLKLAARNLGSKDQEQCFQEPRRASWSTSGDDAKLNQKDWLGRKIFRSASFSGALISSSTDQTMAARLPCNIAEALRSPSQHSFQSVDSWHSLASAESSPVAIYTESKTKHVASCENVGELREDSTIPASASTVTTRYPRSHCHELTCSMYGEGSPYTLPQDPYMSIVEPHPTLERNSHISTSTAYGVEASDMSFRGSSRRPRVFHRSPSPRLPSNIAQVECSEVSETPNLPGKATGLSMIIITKTCEALLAPPAHLIALMLKVAAKLSAGEWRGKAYGYNSIGDKIPVHWDYSEDDLTD